MSRIKLLTLVISTVVTFALTILLVNAQVQLTEQSKVAINGIGSVRVGMTIAQAEQSAKVRLVERGARVGLGGSKDKPLRVYALPGWMFSEVAAL